MGQPNKCLFLFCKTNPLESGFCSITREYDALSKYIALDQTIKRIKGVEIKNFKNLKALSKARKILNQI